MKIEELNSCFDAISPTVEQRDKMFASIMNAKQPVKVVRFYRYATAVAAVFVMGIFGVVYSTMGVNNVSNDATKNIVAMENGEKEQVATATEEYQYLLETAEEEKSVTEEIKKAYPVHNDVTNDTKVAAVEDVAHELISEDVFTETPVVVSENEADTFSAAGSGGGSSYSKSIEAETFSLEQIMNHDVYSKLFPTQFAGDFKFVSANINGNDLNAVFEDAQGRYMSVSIISAEDYGVYECVEVFDIVNIKSQYGYFNFTLNCGEHYVMYNVECDDALQVYEMVKSTEYFKN